MKTKFWSLASLSGLRIWHSHELWCRLQTQLGSCIAVAGHSSSYSSNSTPSLGTSICCRCSPKKKKKKKRSQNPAMEETSIGQWASRLSERRQILSCGLGLVLQRHWMPSLVHQSLTPQAPELHPLISPLYSSLIWFLWLVTWFVWPSSPREEHQPAKMDFWSIYIFLMIKLINWHLVYKSTCSKFQQCETEIHGLIQPS